MKFAIALMNDVFSLYQIPFGATSSALLESILRKRIKEAQEIMLLEIKNGHPPEMSEDDLASTLYRYIRAAQEGAARNNLRLMAGVIAGKSSITNLTADKFLFYADVISSLRPNEIKLLALMAKYDCTSSYVLEQRLGKKLGETIEYFDETFQSLLRTGLVGQEQSINVEDEDDWKRGNKYKSSLYTTYYLTELWEEIKKLPFEE